MVETRQKDEEIDMLYAEKVQELPPEWILEGGCMVQGGLEFSAESSLLL